jgi:hypothetical protein
MSETKVIVSRDLGEFFRQEVTEAKDKTGIELSDSAEFYVVNLLCDFSRKEAAPQLGEEPLALLYKRALEASPAERVQLLKSLGDVALYIAGFFTESIEQSLVDVDYYISMGGNAYGNLSSLVGSQRRGNAFAEVYTQLAKRFTEFVDLLNEISERARSDKNEDLMKLYSRWQRTGSQRIQKLLIDRGLLAVERLPADYLQ